MVDHYSDFFELDPLSGNTSANSVIRALKRQFARHGIPDECITDNGPQFDRHEYSRLAREYGFIIRKSSPYHSRGNGKADFAVKIGPPSIPKDTPAGIRLLASITPNVLSRRLQATGHHPHSSASTCSTDSVPKSSTRKHCGKETEI